MVPNAAFPPASEKGVEATLVPKILEVGAPKAAKSDNTLREGDDAGGVVGAAGDVGDEDRYGSEGA